MLPLNTRLERSAAATRFVIVVIVFGLAAVLLPPVSSLPGTTAAAVGLGGLIAALMVLDREVVAEPFSPLALAGLLWFVGYALRGLVVGLTGHSDILDNVRGAPYDKLPLALLLCAVAVPLLWLGYKLPVGSGIAHRLPFLCFPSASQRTLPQWFFRLYLLYAIGWMGRIALWSVGAYHHSTQLTVNVALFSWLQMIAEFSSLTLWTLFRIKHERGDRLASFLPWFGLEFVNGLIDGARSKMAWAIVIFVVTRNLFSERPFRWRVIIGALVLSGALVFPALSIFRQTYYGVIYDEGRAGAGQAVQAIQSWDAAFRDDGMDTQRRAVGNRFAMLEIVAVVLDRVPSYYPHANGDTFLLHTIGAPIPRFLWPTKPEYNMGRTYGVMFYDDPREEETETSRFIGLAAEFYYNFGWLGIGLMLVVGIWIRLHWERFRIYATIHRGAPARYSHIWTLPTPTALLQGYIGGIWRRLFDLYVYLIALEGWPRRYRPAREGSAGGGAGELGERQ